MLLKLIKILANSTQSMKDKTFYLNMVIGKHTTVIRKERQ